jgi:hypothetical protein
MSPHICKNGYYQTGQKIVSGENVEEREPWYTLGENVD